MTDRSMRLPTRLLPRVELPCPPIVWRVVGESIDPRIVERCLDVGADWFIADCDAAGLQSAAGRWIIGIDADSAAALDVDDATARLRDRFGTVAGVLLQHAESGQIKSGRAVDRIMRLRDALGARLLVIEAADTAMAEWLVDHSPAHAVMLPYDLSDQSAGWRLLDAASELGVGVFARASDGTSDWIDPAPSMATKVSFAISDPRVSAVIIDLPCEPDELGALIDATRSAMTPVERDAWIARFRAGHSAPSRRRHGHAPDEM